MDTSTLANWATIVSLPLGACTAWLYFYVPYCRDELGRNPAYRLKRAETLANPRPWRFYVDFLGAGLAFLDRLMGRPRSWRVLGVCVTLALVYALRLPAGRLGARRARHGRGDRPAPGGLDAVAAPPARARGAGVGRLYRSHDREH